MVEVASQAWHIYRLLLINAALQRGVASLAKMMNRFSGFDDVAQVATLEKPLKQFNFPSAADFIPLKRGVNERAARTGA